MADQMGTGEPHECAERVHREEKVRPDLQTEPMTEARNLYTDGLWRGPDGRPILPPGLRQTALEEAHGVGHVGVAQMMRNLENWWHPFLKDMVQDSVKTCEVCTKFNARPTIKPQPGKFPLEVKAGKEIIIDYTDMITSVRGYRYVLMCVDAYTGWPEAWPTKKEDSDKVFDQPIHPSEWFSRKNQVRQRNPFQKPRLTTG